jgi:hypothetical protein
MRLSEIISRWRSDPWLFTAGGAFGFFLLCSFLPIWTAWHVNSWEGVGYRGTFWEMFWAIPFTAHQVGLKRAFLHYYTPESAILFIVLAVGGFFPWGWLWLCHIFRELKDSLIEPY